MFAKAKEGDPIRGVRYDIANARNLMAFPETLDDAEAMAQRALKKLRRRDVNSKRWAYYRQWADLTLARIRLKRGDRAKAKELFDGIDVPSQWPKQLDGHGGDYLRDYAEFARILDEPEKEKKLRALLQVAADSRKRNKSK